MTAGTIFHKTRKPLRVWFETMWCVTTQKYGANALGLQRALGLGSYETAWTWLHKLRRAMTRPGRDLLRGAIEVDETHVGGSETGVSGRESVKKALVVVAAEVRVRAIGRTRLRRAPDASASSLLPFIQEVIEPGAESITDAWGGYDGLPGLGYRRTLHDIKRSGRKAHELLPRAQRVASLLERWLLGTHQGAVGHEHIDCYLDEFTFRFNRRTSEPHGLLFFRLVENAVALQPTTHRELVAGPARATETTRARSNGSQRDSLFEAAIATLRRLSPTGSALLARVLLRSASARLDGDSAAALPELEEAVALAGKLLPAAHPHLAEYQDTLAKCRAALGE